MTDVCAPGKGKPAPHTLARKVFRVSRLTEFASIAELTKQTGHPVAEWPLVIVKELADNALDAAEEAGTAPVIEIVVTEDSITVADKGPGIPAETISSLVDYSVRTSSRAAYVSPTRGAQGNALQSIIPMGFALADDDEEAHVRIESHGVRHVVGFAVDPVRQTPVVSHAQEPSDVKIGTKITVRWPNSACSIIADANGDFLQLVSTFVWLNPHLTLTVEWLADSSEPPFRREWGATDPGWKKWGPSQPTSPHWYSAERLVRLMAAEIAHAEDNGAACRSVRELVGDFRGLSGTAKGKTICEAVGAERLSVADFHARGAGAAAALLAAMKDLSRPAKPRDLGTIGRDHLLARFAEFGSDPETFVYKCVEIEHDGLPYVIEAAFALDDKPGSLAIEGFNFTPAIGGSPFRLEGRLAEARVEDDDPVIAFVHLTSPRLDFLDKGKAMVALPFMVARQVTDLVKGVTAKWTKQKKAEIRDRQARARRVDAMRRLTRPIRTKEAAWQVMEAAYLKASANGRLPVNPRQIMYAARDAIQKATDKPLDSQYFSQTLLVDYIEEKGVNWDIAWDDRGHFREPHAGREIGLGTLAVRGYVAKLRTPEINPAGIATASVSTLGPAGRFGAVLFIEKEGFTPVLEAAGLPERFDVAVMSTKGISVTAARMLVDDLCGRRGLPLFVLHDFDITGFSIKKTLTGSGRRYRFEHEIEPIDLGLTLAEVERLGLASENFIVDKRKDALARRLRINGATDDEIEFLLSGRRVELNAMTSDVFVRFVEEGLSRHGVTKVVPSTATLTETHAALWRGANAARTLEAELERLNAEPVATPADLEQRVRDRLAAHPEETWDDVVKTIVEEDEAA